MNNYFRRQFRRVHPMAESNSIRTIDENWRRNNCGTIGFVCTQLLENLPVNSEHTNKSVQQNTDQADKICNSVLQIKCPIHNNTINYGKSMEDLYQEVLYVILHSVGYDMFMATSKSVMFSYAQHVFKMSMEMHQIYLNKVSQEKPPNYILRVQVLEAKNLCPKDSNGLNDPYVTLHLCESSLMRYNTSVKESTLNPIWNENFLLSIGNANLNEFLCVEVWDFDAAESVKEKFGKFFDAKGVKGIKKLVKEIAVVAATGQHENELIGATKISLKTIPSSGSNKWHDLHKKNKSSVQGALKLHLQFSTEKKLNNAFEENHCNLLENILRYELALYGETASIKWNGDLSEHAQALIRQHVIHSGLQPEILKIYQYTAYIRLHEKIPLNLKILLSILNELLQTICLSTCDEKYAQEFWNSTQRLLPSCFQVIKDIRRLKCESDEKNIQQISCALNILHKISALNHSGFGRQIFSLETYNWIDVDQFDQPLSIKTIIIACIHQGAYEFLADFSASKGYNSHKPQPHELQQLNQLVQLIRCDLQKAIEMFDQLFSILQIPYSSILFLYYDKELQLIVEPKVLLYSNSLTNLSHEDVCEHWQTKSSHAEQALTVGTLLFELYLNLQRFSYLFNTLSLDNDKMLHTSNYYKWFHGAVIHWLDIAALKCFKRIEKALDLDNYLPIDSRVNYSSSAIDTLTIYYQIKVFWNQLKWVDTEGFYIFIAKIIDDICRSNIFYAEKIAEKFENISISTIVGTNQLFEVTQRWCIAVNNIDYVQQSIKPLAIELGMNDIIERLSKVKSSIEVERCRNTLENVLANAFDTIENKVIIILEAVIKKMTSSMKYLLLEYLSESDSIRNEEIIMAYLDKNFMILYTHLNTDTFDKIEEIFWNIFNDVLHQMIHNGLENRKPINYFISLNNILDCILQTFHDSINNSSKNYPLKDRYKSALINTQRVLYLSGLRTETLIYQVHMELRTAYNHQLCQQFGELTIRIKFDTRNMLTINIMNAKNLPAMDANGLCDPYVKVHFLPINEFRNVIKPKTQTYYKTQYALFDETFCISLNTKQRNEDGLILFSIKDKDLLGYNNQYISEAIVSFKEINVTNEPITSLEQMHLPLFRPSILCSEAAKILEQRQNDKEAREFIRKFKQRCIS